MQSKQGGDANQVPNHLNDLTIWNMCATKTAVNGGGTHLVMVNLTGGVWDGNTGRFCLR